MCQDSLETLSKLIELQNFSQLACVSTLRSSLFLQLINACLYSRVFNLRVLSPKPTFLLISAKVSSEMGLLSVRTLLDFGMALSTAVLIADTIKAAYISRSLVDVNPEKSSEPSAVSSVDSNTSLSVWSNLYLVWLVYEFLYDVASTEISMV